MYVPDNALISFLRGCRPWVKVPDRSGICPHIWNTAQEAERRGYTQYTGSHIPTVLYGYQDGSDDV